MSTKQTLEKLAKNTWLAGLGSIDSSKDNLGKTIDAAQEKSSSLYSELLTRGEAIHTEINDKINQTRADIEAKGKALFGFVEKSTSSNKKSQDESIAELNEKVDALTTAVVGLIEKRSVAKKPAARKTAAKKPAAKKTAAKTTKTASKAAPKAASKTSTKTAVKAKPASTKSTAKASATTAKATSKPATTAKKPAAKKPASKAATKSATTKTAAKASTATKATTKTSDADKADKS